MSDLECPGDRLQPGAGKCFKGVENFLKRIAFNLGNTPSRTEVKIISCIPIDVSDLQQRIILLEKELEEARLCDDTPRCQQKRVVNTVVLENQYPIVSHTGVSCNALDMDRGTNPYDVTLSTKKKSNVSFAVPSAHESRINSSSSHRYGVSTAAEKRYADIMCYDNDLRPFSVGEVKQRQGRKKFFKKKKKSLRQKKPKSHYVYYVQAGRSPFERSDVIDDFTRNNETMTRSYLTKVVNKQYKPQMLGGNLSEISRFSTFSTPVCRDTFDFGINRGNNESDICSCCHGAYQNIDQQSIPYDHQQVYRADNITTRGGFYDSTFYDVIPVKEKPIKIKKPFEVMKKKEIKPSVDIMCWPEDVRTKLRTYPAFNAMFDDYTALLPEVDNYFRKIPKMYKREPIAKNIPRRRNNIGKQINLEMSKSSCIDFGDVYPKLVKKKNDKVDRCLHVDKCLTATEVPRKVDAECLTSATNNSECQTVSSIIHTHTRDSIQSGDDKTEETLNQIKTILQSVLHEVKGSNLLKGASDEKPKKDATVQKGTSQGNVPEPLQSNLAGPIPVQVPGPVPVQVQGNISRLLHGNVQSSIPDTVPVIPHSNIAESLPSNLTGNAQGSRLLGSFTYSPYDIHPYLPSCSKQMNPYYYSQSPIKCYQNFPLFVQNQGRPTCASCFRQSGHVKSHYGKQATTIATNTDSMKVQHSKETEKLIKEIYKSMALTMGAVQKENSSEYEPLNDYTSHIEKAARTGIEKPTPVKEFKKVTNVVQAVSELFRKRDMQASSESHNLIESRLGSHRDRTESRSHNTNTAAESKNMSTDATVLSSLATTTNTEIEMKLRKDRVDKFLNQSKRGKGESPRQDKQKYHARTQNKIAPVELSETSSSESDTDDTFVPQETKQVTTQKVRKEKTSLLSKMFRSVKLFKPRERKKREKKEAIAEEPTSEESSTDSDDYQTVYSQKIDANPKHRPRVYNLSKRRTHSKISYKHVYQRDKSPMETMRRSPYMEQEYRRYWNEKLMFQNRYQKQSSDHPYSQRYTIEQARANPYYRAYEARAAIVQPIRPAPRNAGMPAPRNAGMPPPRNAGMPAPRNAGMPAKKIVLPKQIKKMGNKMETRITSKAVPWLKKHKFGNIRCGEHFKQLIMDN